MIDSRTAAYGAFVLRLTLGLKLDRNIYTGTEVLPSVRLAWKPDAGKLLWGELSRAVRAPSRIDREFFLPGAPPFLIQGGPHFVSEVADVVELGYRAQPSEAFSYSVTLFHHRYDRLRSGEPQAGGYFQVENGTGQRGDAQPADFRVICNIKRVAAQLLEEPLGIDHVRRPPFPTRGRRSRPPRRSGTEPTPER